MKLPDGSVLMHGRAPYDPVKAREYYLRTRKLKGRKKAAVAVGSLDSKPSKPNTKPKRRSSTFTVKVDGKTYKLSEKQMLEQAAYAKQRVASINKKLRKLQLELRKKMQEARAKERESKKPDSAKEKREKADASEKYRDKNQQKLKNKAKKAAAEKKRDSGPNLDTVEGLQEAIDGAKKRLTAALDRQRALASATRN